MSIIFKGYPTLINRNSTLLPKEFGSNSNKYLKYLIIFTIWPIFTIGVSITLYLFYFLYREVRNRRNVNFLKITNLSSKFYLFSFVSVLSFVFSPTEALNTDLLSDIKMQIQFIYWMTFSVFIMNIYQYINKEQFEKYVFIGLFFLTIQFFFFNFVSTFPFARLFVARNSFVFTYLASWPIASSYIYRRLGKNFGNLSLIFVFFIIILTEGRAGSIIILIENIYIYFIYNKASARLTRLLLFIILPLFTLQGETIVSDENRIAIGNLLEPISPRISDFVKGEGASGDLTFDKSWLTRELMISKGFEIFEKYPVFGVGMGNFTKYSAELNKLSSYEYIRLGEGHHYYNTRSSHNTYISVLSELGITGFIVLSTILIPILYHSIKKFVLLSITKDELILVSILGISIHFYSISALPGSLTWLIIGISYSVLFKKRLLT